MIRRSLQTPQSFNNGRNPWKISFLPLHPQIINLFHQTSCLGKGDDDMLIMVDVLEIEGAIFSILEPFLSWLITTDIEIPCDLRHIWKILWLIDIHLPILIANFSHLIRSGYGILCNSMLKEWTFKEVQFPYSFALFHQFPKWIRILWIWNSREINLEEFLILLSICGRMKNCIDIIQKIYWGEGDLLLTIWIFNGFISEFEPYIFGYLFYDWGVEVGGSEILKIFVKIKSILFLAIKLEMIRTCWAFSSFHFR